MGSIHAPALPAGFGYGAFTAAGHLTVASIDPTCGAFESYCTAGTTSHGCAPTLTASGVPSASASSGFTITASGVEGQRSGLHFYGIDNGGFSPLPWSATSTSFLCVKAPLQRMTVQGSGGTLGACDGTFAIDWNAFVASTPGALGAPFAAGDAVYAQAWFRDPPAPKTTNLSDGLEFIVCP